MKKALFTTLGLVVLLGASGCNMTDDPRQGGLFSYSPDKYERRLQDREARLASIEAEQAAEERQSSSLSRDLTVKQKEVAKLKASLNAEQKKIDSQLNRIKKDKSKAAQAAELSRKNAAIRQDAARIDTIDDNAAKKKEIQALRKRLEELKMEADALSRL
jgi:chromosome segregation ATPase